MYIEVELVFLLMTKIFGWRRSSKKCFLFRWGWLTNPGARRLFLRWHHIFLPFFIFPFMPECEKTNRQKMAEKSINKNRIAGELKNNFCWLLGWKVIFYQLVTLKLFFSQKIMKKIIINQKVNNFFLNKFFPQEYIPSKSTTFSFSNS